MVDCAVDPWWNTMISCASFLRSGSPAACCHLRTLGCSVARVRNNALNTDVFVAANWFVLRAIVIHHATETGLSDLGYYRDTDVVLTDISLSTAVVHAAVRGVHANSVWTAHLASWAIIGASAPIEVSRDTDVVLTDWFVDWTVVVEPAAVLSDLKFLRVGCRNDDGCQKHGES